MQNFLKNEHRSLTYRAFQEALKGNSNLRGITFEEFYRTRDSNRVEFVRDVQTKQKNYMDILRTTFMVETLKNAAAVYQSSMINSARQKRKK